MPINLSDFHFLRPEILWLLIPIVLLVFHMNTRAKRTSAWQNVISPHLLEFLFVSGNHKKSRLPIWISAVLASLLVIAASGPSYRQKAVPVFETENAQVILMDLSLSMDATDIKPSRLDRAKFKLLDILEHTKEGTAALVVYAGDAFVISPLTSDANTIANMVPTLSTGIMPVLGSRPDIGINKAIELLKNAKHNRGQIVWLTDGVDSYHTGAIIDAVNTSGYQLSILAIGTEQGAPIPLANGNGFLKDSSGAIVVPKLDVTTLSEISMATQAGYVKMTADESDIEYLKKHNEWRAEQNQENNDEQKISKWIDDGYWLVWLALLLCLIKIIRQPSGSLASFLIITSFGIGSVVVSPSLAAQEQPVVDSPSAADTQQPESTQQQSAVDDSWQSDLKQGWTNLWYTKDQQGQSAYRQGEYGKAADLFENQNWQATSQFKKGDFNQAAQNFSQGQDIRSQYNHATSLGKSQQLQPALDAYNKLLEQEPDHKDALHNKKIVEELLKQQQEKQQQQDQNSDQEKQDQQQQDSQSDQQQQQDEQNSEEQQKQSEQQQQQELQEQQQQAEQKQQEAEISEDERDKSEKDQALEHWLEKIPDDPGGLLRRKMYREYQRRGRKQ
ncbi:MAG: VWA domain-containing protein, partial [Kangiellaceae bacterium]|nr:VWA domain-containing protein [Kangiellaceae bacterium]